MCQYYQPSLERTSSEDDNLQVKVFRKVKKQNDYFNVYFNVCMHHGLTQHEFTHI